MSNRHSSWLLVGKSFQGNSSSHTHNTGDTINKPDNVIQTLTVSTRRDNQSTILNKRKYIEDLDSHQDGYSSNSDEDNDDLLGLIHPNEKINYLPNGRVLITSDHKYDTSSKIAAWYIDSRKDKSILQYEGFTSNDSDIPQYKSNPFTVINTTTCYCINSKSDTIKDPQRMYPSKEQSNTMGTILASKKSSSKSDDMMNHFTSKSRYFSKRYRRFLLDPTYSKVQFHAKQLLGIGDTKNKEHTKHTLSDVTIGVSQDMIRSISDMIVFPYIDPVMIQELDNHQQVLTANNNNVKEIDIGIDQNDNKILNATTCITSEVELASKLLSKINKHVNIILRTTTHHHPSNNNNINSDTSSYIQIMQCISVQDVLYELTCRSSGQSISNDIAFQSIFLKHSKDMRIYTKQILERKISLLENILKIQHTEQQKEGDDITHSQYVDKLHIHQTNLILYPFLCNLYIQLRHPEKIKQCFEHTIQVNQLDFSIYMLQYHYYLTQFNELNFIDTLHTKLNNIRIDLHRTCKNIQAASQLLTLTTSTNSNNNNNNNNSSSSSMMGKLQREQMDFNLEMDLQCLWIDVYLLQCLQTQSFGKKELCVGMIQAILTFHFSNNNSPCVTTSTLTKTPISEISTIDEFLNSYWESELPRFGEINLITLSNTNNPSSSNISNSNDNNGNCEIMDQLNKLYGNSDMNYIVKIIEQKILKKKVPKETIHSLLPVEGTAMTSNSFDQNQLNDTQKYKQPQVIDNIQLTNSLAAAYFLDQLQQSTIEENISSTNMTTEQEIIPEPQDNSSSSMVYSMLHGYKINIDKNHDSGQIYKKILTNISENTIEKTSMTSTNKNNIYPKVILNSLLISTNSNEIKWKQDMICSLFQWRPLRALLNDNSEIQAVEQQPERVLFTDDLKPFLFKILRIGKPSSSLVSNIATITVNTKEDQCMNQRLFIRSLQALGVFFPSTECSHSLLNRLTSNYYIDEILGNLDQDLYDVLISPDPSFSSSVPPPIQSPNINEESVSDNPQDILKILQKKSKEKLCYLSSAAIRKHLLMKQQQLQHNKNRIDSEFDLIINIVKDAALLHTNSSKFSDEFLNELRCLLINLLTIKYLIEKTIQPNSYSSIQQLQNNDNNSNSDNNSSNNDLLILQQNCRSIIEQSVPSPSFHSMLELTSCPRVGNLNVWCQYIESELLLGNHTEALKYADRILKSVDMEYTNHHERKLMNGHSRLIYLCMKYLITTKISKYSDDDQTNPSVTKKQYISLAIQLSIYFAHSGFIEIKDSPEGNRTNGVYINNAKGIYANQMKEAIPKTSKKKKENLVKIAQEDVIAAIEIYQLKAMELMQQFSNAVVIAKKVRMSAFENDCVRISSITACEKLDSMPQDLYYILNILSYLQVISAIYLASFEEDKNHSNNYYHHKQSVVSNAVAFGYNSLKASIDVIKSTLLPSIPISSTADRYNTTTTNLSSTIDDSNANMKSYKNSLLSQTFQCYDTDYSSFIKKIGFADIEYLQNMNFSSSIEVSMIVLLERLYQAQINMLTSIPDLINVLWHIPINTMMTMKRIGKSTIDIVDSSYIHKCLHQVIDTYIRDFPLNNCALSSFVLLHSAYHTSHQGYLYIRAYFRDIKKYRHYWNGNSLQPLECLYAIYNEFMWCTNLSINGSSYNSSINSAKNSLRYNSHSILYGTYCYFDLWLAVAFKDSTSWSQESFQRFIDVLENYLLDPALNSITFIWKCYLEILILNVSFDDAKKVYFRAIHSCGWCKALYMYAFGPLKCVFTDQEVELILHILQEKGFYLRVS